MRTIFMRMCRTLLRSVNDRGNLFSKKSQNVYLCMDKSITDSVMAAESLLMSSVFSRMATSATFVCRTSAS